MKIRDILEAIKKNGYKHSHSGWFEYEHIKKDGYTYNDTEGSPLNDKVISACVLGQAALNLKVSTETIVKALGLIDYDLYREIFTRNDKLKWRYSDLVSYIEKRFEGFEDIEFPAEPFEYKISQEARVELR